MQRLVKHKWLAEKYEAMVRTMSYQESGKESEEMLGEYMLLSQIVWEKKSKEAGLNYVMECLKRHRAGEVYKKGKPWVSFNEFTKFWEFMYVKQMVGSSANRQWTIDEQGKPKALADGAEVTGKASGSEAVGQPPATAAGTANSTPPVKIPKGKTPQGKTPTKTPKDNDPSGTDPADVVKKQYTEKLNRCKLLKSRCEACQMQGSEVMRAIESGDAAWAFGQSYMVQIVTVKQHLEALKTRSLFWQNWATSTWSSFIVYVKKKYELMASLSELRAMDELEKAIETFEELNAKMQRMYQASLS